MKYLNTYKIFEAEDYKEINAYLKDIFLELKDIGYNVNINTTDSTRVLISPGDEFEYFNKRPKPIPARVFKYSEIKDSIDSAVDYMKSIGYYVWGTSHMELFSYYDKNNNGEKLINNPPEEYLTNIQIYFKKPHKPYNIGSKL